LASGWNNPGRRWRMRIELGTTAVMFALLLALGCGDRASGASSGSRSGATSGATSGSAGTGSTSGSTSGIDNPPDAGASSGEGGANATVPDTCNVWYTSCAPGNPCPSGSCCVAGLCVSPGQPCGGSLGTCDNQSCGGCGALNQTCCPVQRVSGCNFVNDPGAAGWFTGPACSDPNTVCADAGAGSPQCVPCGGPGQICCAFNWLTSPLGTCNAPQLACGADGTCTASCDGLGEPCCQDRLCEEGGVCNLYSAGSNECIARSACAPDGVGPDGGMCPATCGQFGLPCCAGQVCTEGTCVSNGCMLLHMR
jgi:hypothetical protein